MNIMQPKTWIRTPYFALEKALCLRRLQGRATPCLPDFLGIGAQKAGTTWLHANLRRHPDLFLPDAKELHFFDRYFYTRHLAEYMNWFRAGAGKVKGEITPAYGILSRQRIRFIRCLVPNVRLLFLTRNPVERAWSQAVMNLSTMEKRRLEDISDQEFQSHFMSSRSRRRGDYEAILDRWLGVFPREQLWIGRFEDIRDRPQALLCEVFQHLGVRTDVNWAEFPYEEVIRPHAVHGSAPTSPSMPERHRVFLETLYPKSQESRVRVS